MEALLNKIIGEQNTAAAAEAAAASALAAIESLTSEQAAAAESIASAYTASLQQIEVNLPIYECYPVLTTEYDDNVECCLCYVFSARVLVQCHRN